MGKIINGVEVDTQLQERGAVGELEMPSNVKVKRSEQPTSFQVEWPKVKTSASATIACFKKDS